MITIFYLFIFLLTLNEIYYILNRRKLDILVKNKQIDNVRIMDIIPYLLKVCSYVIPIIGLFSSFKEYFITFIIINLFRFLIYHLNNRLYHIYIYIVPIVNIIIYLIILFNKFLLS
jgi:hypothetical protein